MSRKHTPGPWSFSISITNPRNCVILGNKTTVAHTVDHIDKKNKSVHTVEGAQANAKLIAAAPALLEACLMAKEELIFGGDWNTAKRIIEEAIEKATK